MDKIESNRLIAEFMGLKYKEEIDSFDERIIQKVISKGHPDKTINQDIDYHFQLVQLKYHTSWDWLMPVVDKIETIYDGSISVKIESIDCIISTGSQYALAFPDKDCHIVTREENRILSTYKAIVEFALWYNQNEIKLNSQSLQS